MRVTSRLHQMKQTQHYSEINNVRVKQHYGGRVPRGTPGITVLPWVGVSHKLVNPWVGVSHKPVNPWVGVSHKQVVA